MRAFPVRMPSGVRTVVDDELKVVQDLDVWMDRIPQLLDEHDQDFDRARVFA
ncbi:hypothetical protein ACFV30_40195 [Streptomyces sp. NPDC059752]|uniref:hypothetical protein n=1 Tax=unclassified Streptomyces TaxID=2593676 RepID=UPI003653A256